jgi:hypothetical protein
MLSDYLITHESQIKKSKKSYELEIEETKKNIISIINSDEFRELIKLNFERFKNAFQELSNERMSNLDYFCKLGEIINK